MRYFVLILLLLGGVSASANDRHYQLAKDFEELSSSDDKAALVDSIIQPLIQYNPKLKEYQDEFRSRMLKILSSNDYKEGKIKIYKDLFTEKELEGLVQMIKSPTYQLLNNRRHEMNKRLAENTMKLYSAEYQKLLDEKKKIGEPDK